MSIENLRPEQDPVSLETAARIIDLIDTLIDNPASLGIPPGVLTDVDPNPERAKPTIDPELGESFEARYARNADVYLEVDRTRVHDEWLVDPWTTMHHFLVEPDLLVTRADAHVVGDQIHQVACVDVAARTPESTKLCERTAQDALAALEKTIEKLSAR